MINKRLLIKNLLTYYDENSFYDKKRQLNLHTKEGKSKFAKHICALSNTNPDNNSFLVIGVEDEDNQIIGVDFFDDSKIQNLIDAYLSNPPQIVYENVMFPSLPSGLVVGLVTIRPKKGLSKFKKKGNDIPQDTFFVRLGSTSVPNVLPTANGNKAIVSSIESMSKNNLSSILTSVLTFMTETHKDIKPNYQVFKENFVVCWAGNQKRIRGDVYYSRVDIELINEQIKLFYSTLDAVTITYSDDKFVIREFVKLGLNDRTSFYPFEEVVLRFYDNGSYGITSTVLFQPPLYNYKMLEYIYKYNKLVLKKLDKKMGLTALDKKRLSRFSHTMMICFLNGFPNAKRELVLAKPLLKKVEDPRVYQSFKEVMRILRKLKYEREKNV